MNSSCQGFAGCLGRKKIYYWISAEAAMTSRELNMVFHPSRRTGAVVVAECSTASHSRPTAGPRTIVEKGSATN